MAIVIMHTTVPEIWLHGKITRVHRDGRVTVRYSTGDKERNVPTSRLKHRKQLKRGKREVMDAARNNFTVRLGQKVEAKKTKDEVGGEDSSSDTGKSKRSVDAAASWHKQQAVVFHVNNVQKSGRLTAIRDDDCDIQHDSDKDHESTNVPFTDVRGVCRVWQRQPLTVELLALRWWHRWTLPTTRFEIQANVRYVDAKGRAHDGVITKRHRDNSYDIRHVSDAETEAQHVAVSDMQSLSVWSQAIESYGPFLVADIPCSCHRQNNSMCHRRLGRVALFNGAPLAVGASVEFQLEDSSKWRAGTICKVRQDGKYNIEYTDNDDDEEEGHDKKVAMKVPSIRVRRRQSSSWTRAMLMLASGSLTLQDGKKTAWILFEWQRHVEASMETTHAALKCTAPMQGTIAWVHRDLKRRFVCKGTRVNLLLEVSDEQVIVHDFRNRLDTTSLHGYSVWRNLNMLANLALDAVVYGWYLLGLGNEIALSVDVLERVGNGHNDAAMQAWYKSVAVDPAVVECLITYALWNARVHSFWIGTSVIGRNCSHPFLKDKPTLAQTPPYLLLPEVMMAWYWLIVLVCLKALAFAYIFVRALRLLVHTGNSIVLRHSGYSYVGLLLAQVTATTTFNLYRGLCFLLVLVASSNFAVRAVMMIPSIAMTAFAWALALTSMQMFVSVQHDVLWRAGYFGLTLLHVTWLSGVQWP
ncbi:hypothetical protein DYB32_004478 [Aphanomyces invadans]|uniref:Uncharacterized protein n=1 Tax=Aphanomyces invadans TaxID=157072 RepID=A0A3R6ZQZ5_9STRA|nr:hypothetical protein DYB32_004478 [Aphanomyces invadans]